ncbi:hypothetical protein EQG49_12140 [Periweissella cryptocerci]|uniref:Uncharacterized protein n=1 Tax=Periweissella cryptocerci TaxID=2506420 RepID=A0A4P6YWF7_9LACO|nr:hypothetical protein [Periweissella cryptocerci]QBO37150.1 hypothetical protein EQG49_12140 [Periweissella cryptocerci]
MQYIGVTFNSSVQHIKKVQNNIIGLKVTASAAGKFERYGQTIIYPKPEGTAGFAVIIDEGVNYAGPLEELQVFAVLGFSNEYATPEKTAMLHEQFEQDNAVLKAEKKRNELVESIRDFQSSMAQKRM